MLESDQPPYTALIVDMLPTNISNPAVIANTYKMGFSIPQNVPTADVGNRPTSFLFLPKKIKPIPVRMGLRRTYTDPALADQNFREGCFT